MSASQDGNRAADEILALIERLEAGRSFALPAELNDDAYAAACVLISRLRRHALGALYRMVPALRGRVEVREMDYHVWEFLTARTLKSYLTYRKTKTIASEEPAGPVRYLFAGRRTAFASFLRHKIVKGAMFGVSEKHAWQGASSVTRSIHRMCRDGRLVEYERVSVVDSSEVWIALKTPRQGPCPAYADRRFLNRDAAVSHPEFRITVTELAAESHLTRFIPARRQSCSDSGAAGRLSHDERNDRFAADSLSELGADAETTPNILLRPEWPYWILSVFDALTTPFPLRGTTFLSLARSSVAPISMSALAEGER